MGAYHYAETGDPVAQANLLVDRAVDLNRGTIPTNSGGSIEVLYTEDAMARLPRGGESGGIGNAVNYQLAVSMLREHDVIVAPGDLPVVLYASYHWAWDAGTGG